jgi:hypothetical protein
MSTSSTRSAAAGSWSASSCRRSLRRAGPGPPPPGLAGQRQLVPLEPVPVGSDEARSRFPDLDHTATRREITVVGDSGQVYRGEAAWLVCLWALAEYRPVSHRLSTRAGAPFARAAVLAAAKYREGQWSTWGARPAAQPGGRVGWAPVVDARSIAAGPSACGDGCGTPG